MSADVPAEEQRAGVESLLPYAYAAQLYIGEKCPSDRAVEGGGVWPSPAKPLEVAAEFVARFWTDQQARPLLRRWRGDFYTWRGTHYAPVSAESLTVDLGRALRDAVYYGKPDADGDATMMAWSPAPAKIRAVLDSLATVDLVYLPDELAPDVDGIAMQNGVLDHRSKTLSEHSPERFNVNALPFAYDPSARCPEWLGFMASLWPKSSDGLESVFLAEWFGYLISGQKNLGKIALLMGRPRSGKSTIGNVITELVGHDNVCYPSLSRLAGTFGLQQFLGKTVAVVGDAEAGAKSAAGALEVLKTISGDDPVTVARKNRDDWFGKLGVRFTLLGNDQPGFLDPSGAYSGALTAFAVHREL